MLELRLIVIADGAAADKFKVRFCVEGPVTVTDEEEKLSAAPTLTVWTPLV